MLAEATEKVQGIFFISFNSKNFRHVVFKNNETTKSQLLYLRIKRWSVTQKEDPTLIRGGTKELVERKGSERKPQKSQFDL